MASTDRFARRYLYREPHIMTAALVSLALHSRAVRPPSCMAWTIAGELVMSGLCDPWGRWIDYSGVVTADTWRDRYGAGQPEPLSLSGSHDVFDDVSVAQVRQALRTLRTTPTHPYHERVPRTLTALRPLASTLPITAAPWWPSRPPHAAGTSSC